MKVRFLVMAFALMCFACSQEQDVSCESGHGYLYKDGKEFGCPFTLQTMSAPKGYVEWLDFDGGVTLFDVYADDYAPLKHVNSPAKYRVKMNVLKERFTEEQYTVSLQTIDKNHKPCGEPKEFTFYKVAESVDSVEYKGRTFIDSIGPVGFLFFGLKEMPSYDWYHVLKVCEGNSFYIKGEVIE